MTASTRRRRFPSARISSPGCKPGSAVSYSPMHAAGRSLEEIGDYVGHGPAYMTDQYRHLLDGARTEAAAAFDALLEA